MSFKLELDVEEITVFQRKDCADNVYILITGHSPFPKVDESGPVLVLEVAKGYGVDYVLDNFGYVPKVISLD